MCPLQDFSYGPQRIGQIFIVGIRAQNRIPLVCGTYNSAPPLPQLRGLLNSALYIPASSVPREMTVQYSDYAVKEHLSLELNTIDVRVCLCN